MRFGDVWIRSALAAAIVAAVVVVGEGIGTPKAASVPPPAAAVEPVESDVVVYKSPTCGCCDGWIDHLRAAGFRVVTRDTSDVGAVKRRLGVLPTLVSCHTAIVNGYVLEGHVPADDILRMLEERPAIVGLAVPGMPAGSPGMEAAQPHVSYEVVTFDGQGRTTVFSRR